MSINLGQLVRQFVPRNGEGYYYFINPNYLKNKMGGKMSKCKCEKMIKTIKELHKNDNSFSNSHIFIPKGILKATTILTRNKQNRKKRRQNDYAPSKFRECSWPVVSSVLTTIKEDPYSFTSNFDIEDENLEKSIHTFIEDITGNTSYMCGSTMSQEFFSRDDEKDDSALIILKFNKKQNKKINFRNYATNLFDFFNTYNPDEEEDLKDSRILLHIYSFIETYYEESDDEDEFIDILTDELELLYNSIGYTCTGLGVIHDLNYNEHPEDYLYINGVCSNERGVGKKIIESINYIGFKSGYKGTKLASLTYVIPYYWKYFNFRFKNQRRTNYLKVDKEISQLPLSRQDDGIFSNDGGDKYVNLVKHVYSNGKNNASKEVLVPKRYLIKDKKKKKPGKWREGNDGPWFQQWWKDVNSISLPTRNTGKQFEKLEVGDQGWYMYFDYDDKPYYEHDKSLLKLQEKLSSVSKMIMNCKKTNNKTQSCIISGGRKNKTRKKYN
jgi:hypothetical protein